MRLFSPGYWNQGSGPDFRNAEFAFDNGPRERGDVELHVRASGWYRHKHENDPAYGRVKLHVVLENDLSEAMIRHGDRDIPQLALSLHLSSDLGEIIGALDPAASPVSGAGREAPCCRSARALDRNADWIARLLDVAGDQRMLLKSERLTEKLAHLAPDEVLYAALMDCMGFSANRTGFRRLCQAAPLSEIRRWVPTDASTGERQVACEAILLGVGGFLDAIPPDRLNDAASAGKAGQLSDTWSRIRPSWPHEPLPDDAWVLKGTRPANQPLRRAAAMAAFLAAHLHSGLCRAILHAIERVPADGTERSQCRQALQNLSALFEVGETGYWSRRAAFGPERLKYPTRLVGPARVGEIVVNALIPLMLALAAEEEMPRIERRLHNLYSGLKPTGDNAVTRYMKTRIFAEPADADSIINSSRRQQGLLQIFHDFCNPSGMTCEDCAFLAAVEERVG